MINIKYKDLIGNGVDHSLAREVIGVLLILKVQNSNIKFETKINEEDVEIRVINIGEENGPIEVFIKAKLKYDDIDIEYKTTSMYHCFRAAHKQEVESSGDKLSEEEERLSVLINEKYGYETDLNLRAIKAEMSKEQLGLVYLSIKIRRSK